ncbi:MAG: type I-E CRISPR-associated protein Cas5/CasD [Candidatus Hatepunaea meridiana]|nr:type I-E CRISPR-associated protein Cas5/CasD [Candidatus Hatepunaea meridiana]
MNEKFTLLLRLEGPMQSWGYRSRFDYRDTALEPTRSGVIGLICAAIGIAREEKISHFDMIRMGVRVDKEGKPERDYHTALNVIKADGKGKGTVVSYRDYLADASFTVGLESENKELLDEIAEALQSPEWALFLGRKAFSLAEHPLSASIPAIVEAPLSEALNRAAFSLRCKPKNGELVCRMVIESPDGERTQHDCPVCFGERRFKPRSLHSA